MIGIDFGTTNSAVAAVRDGQVQLAQAMFRGKPTTSWRSVLYFSVEERVSVREPAIYAGPTAIEQCLNEGATGRLLLSLKSLLPSRTFETTQILGCVYTLPQLIAELLRRLRVDAEKSLGPLGDSIVVGRPVEFVGARSADDEELALARLREAFRLAGFSRVEFEYEPVAAAWFYASQLDHDELLLVADFGGGTSDFTVMRVGPGTQALSAAERVLARDGVGIAGDKFDSRIVEAEVAPRLGRGGNYGIMGGGKAEIPDWLYVKLRDWHELSFLKEPRPFEIMKEIARHAENKKAFGAFLSIVSENLGFDLYQVVEQSKQRISSSASTDLSVDIGDLLFDSVVYREKFEQWIQPDIARIAQALDRSLAAAGVTAGDIDRVFMTGGTAFTPAVRRVFSQRFGENKLAGGNELTSVASGLALRAAQLFGP